MYKGFDKTENVLECRESVEHGHLSFCGQPGRIVSISVKRMAYQEYIFEIGMGSSVARKPGLGVCEQKRHRPVRQSSQFDQRLCY